MVDCWPTGLSLLLEYFLMILLFFNFSYHRSTFGYSFRLPLSRKLFVSSPKLRRFSSPQDFNSLRYNIRTPDTKPRVAVALDNEFPKIYFGASHFLNVFNHPFIFHDFVVPTTTDWPADLHGYKLGRNLEKLVTNNAWKESNPKKMRLLKNLGIPSTGFALDDDWPIVYTALVFYSKMYGHVRVPQEFVVPAEPPWPKPCHRLDLGDAVHKIRHEGKYVKLDIEREKLLFYLEFDWVGRDVRADFPPGYGWTTRKARRDGVPLDPIREELEGDPFIRQLKRIKSDATDSVEDAVEFQDFYCALYGYWKLHNGTIPHPIPRNFTINYRNSPADQYIWPPRLLDFPLGKNYHLMFTEGKYISLDYEYTLYLKALGVNVSWPSAPRDDYLITGEVPPNRKRRVFTEEELFEKRLHDFNYDLPIPPHRRLVPDEVRTLSQAVKVFRRLHGDEAIPFDFVVPRDNLSWPSELWGLALGKKVESVLQTGLSVLPPKRNWVIVNRDFFMDYKILDAVRQLALPQGPRLPRLHWQAGFNSSFYNMYLNERSVRDEFNPFDLSKNPWVDPEEWAEQLQEDIIGYVYRGGPRDKECFRHYDLGIDINTFNAMFFERPNARQRQEMRDMGHRYIEFQSYNWPDVLRVMKLYKVKFGHLDVPANYTVDDVLLDTSFLQDHYAHRYYRMPLGRFIEEIRCGDIDGFEDPERRPILDKLGFRWGDPKKYLRFRYVPLASALQLLMRRFHSVSDAEDEEYVIPDSLVWPEWMKGMPVGKWLAIAKLQKNVLFNFYPDKFEFFRSVWIDWGNARFNSISYDPKYWSPPT